MPWITGQNTFVSIAATFPALCRNVAGMRAGEIIRDVRTAVDATVLGPRIRRRYACVYRTWSRILTVLGDERIAS